MRNITTSNVLYHLNSSSTDTRSFNEIQMPKRRQRFTNRLSKEEKMQFGEQVLARLALVGVVFTIYYVTVMIFS